MTTKDTMYIQLTSLDCFMYALGYERAPFKLVYEFKYPVKTGERFISFQTAVKLHNATWLYLKEYEHYYAFPFIGVYRLGWADFKLDAYQYRKAEAHKIVEQVKLQADKRGRLIVQNHNVKFMSPELYQLFLGD